MARLATQRGRAPPVGPGREKLSESPQRSAKRPPKYEVGVQQIVLNAHPKTYRATYRPKSPSGCRPWNGITRLDRPHVREALRAIRVTAVAVVDQADIADRGAIQVVTTITGFVTPAGFCHLLQVRTLAPGVRLSMTRRWEYIASTPYGMNIDSDIDLTSPGVAANRSHKNGGATGG